MALDRKNSAPAGTGAAPGSSVSTRPGPDWYSRTRGHAGFLSRSNPLATAGQRAIEDRALALLARPELQQARKIVTLLWHNATAWPLRDQSDMFEPAIDEYMFHHAFRAANGDPNFPQVGRFMVPPHEWFGRAVPGSRWGGDSPDFTYRTIPIEHGCRYEIRGIPTCDAPPFSFYSLMADNTSSPVTLTLLESLDMEIESDGSFTISVDDAPPGGRRNHLQTKPGAEFLMIRDAVGDWLRQSPNALTVARLGPTGAPRTEDEMARHAAKIATESFYYTYYLTQNAQVNEPNHVRQPLSSAVFGGVNTQAGTKGTVAVAEDEALIVRCNAAGAAFRNLVLTNLFMISHEPWKRTSSLNMDQMAADADGDFTMVISHRDPGIHNWIDLGGMRRALFGHRWQAFARDAKHEDPWMTTKLVKHDRLEAELPGGVRPIDTQGRQAQITARAAGFAQRFVDC